jgi:peptidoglycan/LPS O-acetylase OafA/YrhL
VIFLVCDLALGAVYVRNALDAARPLTDAGTGRITNPVDLSLHLSLLHTFVPAQMQTGIPPAWSLMTELVFYLMLPIVVLIARGRRGWRLGWALAPPMVFFVVGIVGRFALARQFASSGLSVNQAEFGSHGLAVVSRSLLAFADTFAVGMVVAVVFVWTEGRRWPRWTSGRAAVVGWVLIVVGSVGGLLLLNVQHWFVSSLTSLAAAGLLLLVADSSVRGRPTWISRLTAVSPLRRVGEVSYSLYLWHMPVMVLVSRFGWFRADSLGTLVGATGLVALLSIALAAVTFVLIERPAMRWASR